MNSISSASQYFLWRKAASLGLSLGAAFLAGAPLSALAAATLHIVEGSGDMQSLQTTLAVTSQQSLTMQWTTDQAGAAGGTWKALNAAGQVVASGEATPAPAPGKALRFSIPQNAFLQTSVASSTQYRINIQPHDGVMQSLGTVSPNVTVTQQPAGTGSTGPIFGDNANFPAVEIVSYEENTNVIPPTANLVVRVANKSTKASDPAWLNVKDANVLLRQTTGALAVPVLNPGQSTTFTLKLDAVLPVAPTPQLQHHYWRMKHYDNCGPVLSSVLDWRGPASDAPMGDHLEKFLVKQGWSDYAKVSPNTPICQGTQCVKVCQIEKNIKAQLDNKVMGYAFFAGQYPKLNGFESGGKARIEADAPETAFKSNTKITVASVTKMVTALTAIRLIGQRAATMPNGLDTRIGAFLPSDWAMQSTYLSNLTFAQLLSQTSGIKDYGNVDMTYDQLKKFFTQKVNTAASTTCQSAKVINPANPVNTMDQTPCYSNYNTAIMRLLLPRVAGFAEDANLATRPATLANQYQQLVQQHVFNPVGQFGVTCKPPVNSTNYAFAYKSVGQTADGSDFGDVSSICGAAGLYLSVEDLAKVMLSLSAGDGKILTPAQFATMRQRALGWDIARADELEKNGGWGTNCNADEVCDNITTSVALFGPVFGPRVPAVLFINSNITGGGGAKEVLEKAYKDALYPKP